MNKSVFSMLLDTFKTRQKQRSVRYTHWDIKALAREIAPEKWAAFDSSPAKDGNGIDKYYAQREFGLNASMSIAAKLLDAGWVNRDRPMLWNDAQLDRFVSGSQHHKIVD